MKKRTILMIVSLVAAMLVATTSTLAFLTDTDADVNVMVVGNVEIEQNEQQRPEIGSTELEDFEQFKPIMPGVYDGDEPALESDASQWPIPEGTPADEEELWQVYDNEIANVLDKFVTVENTGRNDAYVRTFIAYECPEELEGKIHLNYNDVDGVVEMSEAGSCVIDGVRYNVICLTYPEALEPGDVTPPSLKQILLDKTVTSEEIALLGDTFDVIAMSQAVQADGFDTAEEAFTDAFYPADTDEEQLVEDLADVLGNNYPFNGTLPTDNWLDTDVDTSWYNAGESTFVLNDAADLAGLAKLVNGGNHFSGKTVKLGADIDLQDHLWTPIGQTGSSYGATGYFMGTFNGQGHTIRNLFITETNEGGNYAAGLFGFIDCGMTNTIGNFTIDGAQINGHHWTGAAAGYLSGTLENVTVKNSAISCTHANDDACGDKAGAVVGYVNGTKGAIKNCSAKNCTVEAGRDAGQVVGCAPASQVTDCSASSVTVSATPGCTGKNIREEVIGRLN